MHSTRRFSDQTVSAIFGTKFGYPYSRKWETNIGISVDLLYSLLLQKNRTERNFLLLQVKTYMGAEARSGKTRSPLPLTPRRRLHPSDRLSPILSSCLQAWCILSNPRIIVAQLYLVTYLPPCPQKGWQAHSSWILSNRVGWQIRVAY